MCSLTALLACFSMSGFYVDASIIHSNKGAAIVVYDEAAFDTVIKGMPITVIYPLARIEENPRNPYGRISVGYDLQLSKSLAMRLDYSHESSLATNADRGEERITVGLTWRPFR